MELPIEAYFARKLADNAPDVREKALKEIGEWFETVSVATAVLDEDILLKMWKGLYYYFWHCDKMLVQEEKAEIISQYIHNFRSVKFSFLYLETFFKTMAREWHGIDRFRLDKFMMLTRFLLHQGFQLVKNHKWEVKFIKRFVKALKSTVLNPSSGSAPFGLKSHITDIYMEELANVGADEVTPKILRQFLLPYCRILYCTNDDFFMSHIEKDIFLYLLNQGADEEEFGEFPVLQFKPNALQKLRIEVCKT
ncbi:ribosomal RNA processing protein 1 homolog A [Trichonephila inaurata madagascariensis]|uniref:Ribosomal RNA processing protein 1 homolog A n=1 Tax=Trichonephila inaurata madagascariensis TaxID=2747483 RepID=A0A8X6WWW5_9ARAC|nr:ribosomal RNA processing protein 1 homolog A [Trichonephila inaurata madagascariensis]